MRVSAQDTHPSLNCYLLSIELSIIKLKMLWLSDIQSKYENTFLTLYILF